MAVAVSGVLMLASASHAAFQIVQFSPQPISSGLGEFSWAGNVYTTAPGSTGNGDGNLPIAAQTPGGLEVDTPLTVLAPAGSGEIIDLNGSHFFDVTLSVQGLVGAGATFIPGFGAIQLLTNGSFSFNATNGVPLLTGTLTNNSITVPQGSTSSGYQSATVTYTGGLIWANFLALYGPQAPGSASISMTSLDGPIGIVPAIAFGPTTVLPFDADATGVLDTPFPEPASLSLVGAAGLLALRRRRA